MRPTGLTCSVLDNGSSGWGSILARVKLCCSWAKCFTSERISPPHCMDCTGEVDNKIQQNIKKNKSKIMEIACDRLPPSLHLSRGKEEYRYLSCLM